VYRPLDVKAKADQPTFGEPRYVVYIVRQQGEVQWVELGKAKVIDEAVAALRSALCDPKRRDVHELARAVDEKVMQPVRKRAGDASQLLFSPDGVLNLLPVAALVDEKGSYLIERYSISYLTSGRDLLRLQMARQSRNAPLVLADPVFGEPGGVQMSKAEIPAKGRLKRDRLLRSVTTGSDLSEVYFARLEGTSQEAGAIRSLFPDSVVMTGTQATESTLKQAAAPRLVHIATHGFFLEPNTPTGPQAADRRGINLNVSIENPLLRSGLALAGANVRSDTGDDGILTAMEAAGLNLWGTKLVTLSACDTGVGEVKNGEGVYGLRRAFVLAGAETLVMSLWPVSDRITRELMTRYYEGLKQGQGRGEALRQMQLDMLKQKERQHPFYWASFIQSGEWANLEGKR
jgi:CHAT domain-containing protein